MKRPSLQFYCADWRGNSKLRRCSFAERGIWVEIICLLHDSDEYGILRWPLVDLAQAIGCRVADLQSLRRKGVLKGADIGERCDTYIHQGYHARQPIPPVTLIPEQPGPIWYSSRMVLDEHRREHRGGHTRFSEDQQPDRSPDRSPDRRQGDGSSSSSSEVQPPSPLKSGNGKRRPRRQRLPTTACPDSFEVTPEMVAWTKDQGLPADRVMPETEKFLDHWKSKGEMRADWQASWRTWMRKAVEFTGRRL